MQGESLGLLPVRGGDDADWERRVEVWRDPRAMVGASDAGAHLDLLATFNYCTTLIAETVRKRSLLSVEEAVTLLTDDQAYTNFVALTENA